MADYITKESVHTMVRHLAKFAWASPINSERRITVDTDDVHFGIDKIPAADVAPVVHGRWLKPFWAMDRQRVCSVCHSTVRMPSSNKALTNADLIRAAPNQQLAKLLYDNQKEFCSLMYKNLGFEDELYFSGDYSDILAWLNAPIEGNGESIGGDEGCLT